MAVPQYYIAAVPLLVAVVSGWLNDDGLAPGVNSFISLIVLVGVAWVWASVNSLFTGNLATNIVIDAGISAALVYTPDSPLYALRRWLIINTPSPIGKLPQSITISVRPTTQPTQAPVEQRASLVQPDAQWAAKPTTPPVQPDASQDIPLHYQDTASIPAIDVQKFVQPSITLPPSSSPVQPLYPAYAQPTQPPVPPS